MTLREEIVLGFEGITVTFSAPARDAGGLVSSFAVTLKAIDFSAKVRGQNPNYGSPPSEFFSELAEKARGWKGEIKWRSTEAELDLIALADSLGHITITANLRPDAYPAKWRASASVTVDSGQLEQVSSEFAAFFASRIS
jgi:hypothetical protein